MTNYQVITKIKDDRKINRKINVSAGSINDVEEEVKKSLGKKEYIYDIVNISVGNNYMNGLIGRK